VALQACEARILLLHLMLLVLERRAAARLLHAPAAHTQSRCQQQQLLVEVSLVEMLVGTLLVEMLLERLLLTTAGCFCLCRLCYSSSQKLFEVTFDYIRTSLLQALAAGSDAGQIFNAQLVAAA
jgi:hypothetical protein